MNVGTSKQAGGYWVSTISLLGCSTSVALATGPIDEEEGKWRYNGGRRMTEEERKRVRKEIKVVRDIRRKQTWALLSRSRPEWDRNKECKSEAG